jgi:MtrB/PioB family decaheme-associated outer membrane protein
MKLMRTILSLALTGAVAFPPSSVAAVNGEVTVGVEAFGSGQDNAKFREYRYGADTSLGATTTVDLKAEPTETRYYDLALKARTPEDVDLAAETGKYGRYAFGLGFSRMGHNFAFGAPTLYSGTGTNFLTIPDSTQASLQGYTAARLPGNASGFVAGAGKTDLGLRRDRAEVDLAWNLSKPLTLNVDMDYEKRKGTRPYFGSFGFGNTVELAEPIDYDTARFQEGLEYQSGKFYASVEHSLSVFNNANTVLVYDNPFRSVDSSNATAYTGSNAAGPATGRNSLAPDNVANHVTASIARELPMHSRVSASAAFGWLRQDDKLAPVTTNTRVSGFPLSLPRESAEASVDTRDYALRFTSRPLKKLHVKADYRYESHENDTAVTTFSNVRTDATAEPSVTTGYVSFVKRLGEVEAAYDVAAKTTLSLAAENEHANFDRGSARKENENIYKVALDTRRIKHTDLRVAYEMSTKASDYPDYTLANAELPWMQKYYAATRDRNKAVVMASVTPSDRLTTGLELTYGSDDYPGSEFGLQESGFHTASVDADYAVTERITVSPSYTVEMYSSEQRSRQWTPNAVGDPYNTAGSAIENPSNWTVETRDVIHTPGLSVDVVLVPEKLDFNASGTYARANTTLDYRSAVGTAATDANRFEPQDPTDVDDSTLISIGTRFDYALKKDLKIGLGYLYESWRVKDDFIYDGYNPVAVTNTGTYNGLLTSDTAYKPYSVHAVYVTTSYKF